MQKELKEGHIEIYDLELETKTPVFIGSGDKYYKRDYAYKESENKFYIMDLEKLSDLLIKEKLDDEYEEFMADPQETDLYKFLHNNKVSDKKIKEAASYSLDAPKGAPTKKGALTDILEFIKDGRGNPYVPGSSIKGALRTVILLELIRNNDKIKSTYKNDKNLSKIANYAEVECLNLLGVNNDKKNAINSVMRGISVSDSNPFNRNEDLILQKKLDIKAKGKYRYINVVTRESLKIGRMIKAKLCLDMSILNGTNIDIKPNKTFIEFIEEAINNFAEYYKTYYLSKFKDTIKNKIKGLNESDYNKIESDLSEAIIIGGGSGFFAKNIIYEMLGEDKGLDLIRNYMHNAFRKHKHDEDNIISPHCLKYAEDPEKARHHFGICKVTITEDKRR